MQTLASFDAALKDRYLGRKTRSTMPAKSKRQYRMMQAAAHDPSVARRVGIGQSQAREFVSGQSPKRLPESAPRNAVDAYRRRRRGR